MALDKNERLKLELTVDQADTWVKRYHQLAKERAAVRQAAGVALGKLRGGQIEVESDGNTFSVLPLGQADVANLTAVAKFVGMPPTSAADTEILHQLETEVPESIRDAQPLLSARASAKKMTPEAQDAAGYLSEYVTWGLSEGVDAALDRMAVPGDFPEVALQQALEPRNGLVGALRSAGTPELLPAASIRGPLATFTAAERFAGLARAVGPSHDYVVVTSPPGTTALDLVANLDH
ncbi:MAG: hypothetical protein FWG25_04825 [Promicromonosporaceae bacterium]|nr:hypothetical protein [Promicromonosporaceae bacterium]